MTEPRDNRVPFMMSDSELAAVDDWRFANKIPTRAEALRRLCQIGLDTGTAFETIDVLVSGALDWLDAERRWSKTEDDEPTSEDPSRPAPAPMQARFIATNVLLAAMALARDMSDRKSKLESVTDFDEALKGLAELSPDVEDAYTQLTDFLDHWKEHFPDKPMRPAREETAEKRTGLDKE